MSRGERRRMLREDDSAVGLGTTWVNGIIGSRMVRGAQYRGLGEDDIVTSSGTTHVWSIASPT
jgi:hypothetical protein